MGPLAIAAIAAAALGGLVLYKHNKNAQGFGDLPPSMPVPEPPPEVQADPAGHAEDPPDGMKMGVASAAKGTPTTGVVKGSDGTELAFTTIIQDVSDDGESAVIQWLPPIDIGNGFNNEFMTRLHPGGYYWAVFI